MHMAVTALVVLLSIVSLVIIIVAGSRTNAAAPTVCAPLSHSP